MLELKAYLLPLSAHTTIYVLPSPLHSPAFRIQQPPSATTRFHHHTTSRSPAVPVTSISIHRRLYQNNMSSSEVNLESYLVPLEEINRATENFSKHRCIGGGGFGAVFRGQLSERWQNCIAAIKRLSRDSFQGEREFRNELEMISRFHHENIISFIGYCDEGDEMIIVFEYAIKGSLDHHLQDPNKMRCITWTQRLMICIGAARGLNYLHSGLGEHNRVIHRDVKSANILLDGNMVPKICDFGLSKFGLKNQQDTHLYTKVAGTQFYLDPTYHESRILRKESDVYSFGVVLFEMLSGMLAYQERSFGGDERQFLINSVRRYYEKEPDKLIDPHIRDQIYSSSFDKFKEIAYRCISFNLMERPTLDMVIERIEEALTIQEIQMPGRILHTEIDNNIQTPSLDGQLENAAILIECVKEDIGFSNGKPIAAYTIYKCLLHWKYFESGRTTIFNHLIRTIISAIEDKDNNNLMAYWLSNTSTLLFLIQKSLKPNGAGSTMERPTVDLGEAEAAAIQQIEAKYPALLFKQQLTTYVEKNYGILRDNLKKELESLLALCVLAPRTAKEVQSVGQSSNKDSKTELWKRIVHRLDTLLTTLTENFVPTIIVEKMFSQLLSYINVKLFNSILLRPECCTFTHGDYVKTGLQELEIWCVESSEEWGGSAWDELKHITQAVGFLVIHQKPRLSFDEIINDLCPILSMEQLYRLCTIYWDDKYGSWVVSQDVISSINKRMTKDSNRSNSFLLEDSSSIPFFVGDLSTCMQVKDFENVKPAEELFKYQEFHFLYN